MGNLARGRWRWYRLWYHPTVVKSTVYLDTATILALRQLAKARGKSQAELIREAVTGYARRAGRPAAKGVGVYRSGRSDVSEQAESLLRRAARRR